MRSWLIGWIGYITISVIGRTMRWQSIGESHLDDIYKTGKRAIFAFWHGRIFPATYYYRKRGIVVMTSMSRDGEPIAQCIQRFGFGTARGSSSAGWLRALTEMSRAIRSGRDAGFSSRRATGTSLSGSARPHFACPKDGRSYLLLSYLDEA